MKKLLLAFVAIVALFAPLSVADVTIPVAPQQTAQAPKFNKALVPQLKCGNNLGSGFIIGSTTIITAEHVADDNNCAIRDNRQVPDATKRNMPIMVTMLDEPHDFAVLKAPKPLTATGLPISCKPMVAGETYWLVGYAGGYPKLAIHPGIADARYFKGRAPDGSITHHLRAVNGRSYQGMSGGPVFNSKGEVVALVNATSVDGSGLALVKELVDTKACMFRSDK